MKKRYYQTAKENWRGLLRNPLTWIFGLLAIATHVFQTSSPRIDEYYLRWIEYIGSLLIAALSTIGSIGLIHIADTISIEPALTFSKIWKRSLGSFLRVIAIDLILGLIITLPFVCLYAVFRRDYYENPLLLLVSWIVGSIVAAVGMLSACGVVISGLGIFDSLKNGVRIFGRVMADMLLLAVASLAVPMIATAGSFLVLTILNIDMNLPTPIPITIQTYNQLIRIPAIAAIRVITNFIILPLWTILIALAYKEHIGEINSNSAL